MAVIYGLYSTRDGRVRYVGQAEYATRKFLDLIITNALEHEPGAPFDWVRDEWRDKHEVRAHVLQDEITPGDVEIFEAYWIEQFSGLLNAKSPATQARPTTAVGQRVNDAILALLRGETTPEV